MKKTFLLLLMMSCFVVSYAQVCFDDTMKQGVELYNKGKYKEASDVFNVAKTCPDIKDRINEVNSWLKKCTVAIEEMQNKKSTGTSTGSAQPPQTQSPSAGTGNKPSSSGNSQQYASTAYMKIKGIDFGIKAATAPTSFYTTLKASDVRYLVPRIHYDGLASGTKNVKLFVRLIKPDGSLDTGTGSPDGYTYAQDVTVLFGTDNYMILSGWGNAEKSLYMTGEHRIEIWYDGKKIYQQNFTLTGGGLTVNGNKTSVSSSVYSGGSTVEYTVSNGGKDYEVKYLPTWATLYKKSQTSFSIKYDANYASSSREDWFSVVSGSDNVRVNVTQYASSSSSYSSSSYSSSKSKKSGFGKGFDDDYRGGFRIGYVQKQWVYKVDGSTFTTGIWGQGEKWTPGLQVGFGAEPYLGWYMYLNTGLFYELYWQRSENEYVDGYDIFGKYLEHSLYAPAHLQFKLPLSDKFYVSLEGGIGIDLGLSAVVKYFDEGESEPYYTSDSIYGDEDYGDMKRFNLSAEFGGSICFDWFKVGVNYSSGLSDMSLGSGYKVNQNKLAIHVTFMF